MPKLCEPPAESWEWVGMDLGPRAKGPAGGLNLGRMVGPEGFMGNHLRVSTWMPERQAEERRVGQTGEVGEEGRKKWPRKP